MPRSLLRIWIGGFSPLRPRHDDIPAALTMSTRMLIQDASLPHQMAAGKSRRCYYAYIQALLRRSRALPGWYMAVNRAGRMSSNASCSTTFLECYRSQSRQPKCMSIAIECLATHAETRIGRLISRGRGLWAELTMWFSFPRNSQWPGRSAEGSSYGSERSARLP